MVPMTLISFIDERPPADRGVATSAMCTTVSTPWAAITLPIVGLRMSARTKELLPRSCRGGVTSAPSTTWSSFAASARAKRAPRSRETPVTKIRFVGTVPGRVAGLLAGAATLDTRALEQLAVLLLRHPLAPLLDDRTHKTLSTPAPVAGQLGHATRPRWPVRAGSSPDREGSCTVV